MHEEEVRAVQLAGARDWLRLEGGPDAWIAAHADDVVTLGDER